MKRLLTPVLFLAAFAAATLGCKNSSLIVAAGLRVELTGITRSADGAVSASWRMANPNVVSYLLASTSHKVFLNGVLLGTIVDQEPLGIPATTNVDRTARIIGGDAAAARVLTDALAQGSGSYRVDSQIVIRIYDDNLEKAAMTNSGTVPVTAK